MMKCKGVGDLVVMEVSQMVGVRTRSRTLALAAAEAEAASSKRRKTPGHGEFKISYMQLRSRNLVMTPQISRSPVNSGAGRLLSSERGRIYRCASNGSCEVAENEEEDQNSESSLQGGDDLETTMCYFECSRERREAKPWIHRRDESGDLESTAERKMMPLEEEIMEFFAVAERTEKRRFAEKYNYDVDNDVPLEGRYEWVQLKP